MGCPCREIRRAIAHLPGGRTLIGLLPELPRSKGPTMRMRMQTTPGQRIMTIAGHHYAADAAGFINDVDPEDRSELLRVGCRIVGLAVELPAEPSNETAKSDAVPAIVAPGQQWDEDGKELPTAAAATEPLDPAAAGHHEEPERSAQ
jgi:hypothetical protein